MNDSIDINGINNEYLTALKKSHSEALEVSAQIRSCASNLLKLGNEIDADRLAGLVGVISAMDDTAKYLQYLVNRQHKMMAAKPGEIITLE